MTRRARLLVVGVLAAMFAAGLVAPASPALADCTYDCRDNQPIDPTCAADAYVVGGVTVTSVQNGGIGHVDLWFSPSCGASWGEYVVDDDEDPVNLTLQGVRLFGGCGDTRCGLGLCDWLR